MFLVTCKNQTFKGVDKKKRMIRKKEWSKKTQE